MSYCQYYSKYMLQTIYWPTQMYQGCPKVNAVESQLVLIVLHDLKICIVFLEDDVEEVDCPAKEDNWEDDESHLDKV